METPLFVRPERAAEILSVKLSTLERWRSNGTGPQYYMIGGQCRYDMADLVEYIESRRVTPEEDCGEG